MWLSSCTCAHARTYVCAHVVFFSIFTLSVCNEASNHMIISCVRCGGVLFGTKMVSNPRYSVLLITCALPILSCPFCYMDHGDKKTDLIQGWVENVEFLHACFAKHVEMHELSYHKNMNEPIQEETLYATWIAFRLFVHTFSFGSLNHKMGTI